jgi:NADH-quinone oxidoreductase subunit L
MELNTLLPLLLGLAWLLPLASFVSILLFGPRMGKGGRGAAYVATAAIVTGFVLSATAMVCWLMKNPLVSGHEGHGVSPHAVTGDWYLLGGFGTLQVTVGYYIDSLTLAMFCMVTLIASCIHVYASGYMHGELSEVFDASAPLSDGQPLHRQGRYYRFFQCLSLFCFSMLGLVIAGNVAMVFVFWELVGICSYLLIGFWHERKSASNAANKAFITNRVGDFGMLIGLMAVWTGMGTFSFGDYQTIAADGAVQTRPGIFSQVQRGPNDCSPRIPDGMVKLAAGHELEKISKPVQILRRETASKVLDPKVAAEEDARIRKLTDAAINAEVKKWRAQGYGYGLLVLAGLGIFCGCVGKSAQFPLHVWLPDAMEGPTPVSALIHAATMVAAGVYLVGRFYPVFTPEVLLVIATIGGITLFIAATIALVATDIKRVLAYSTVSQLGFMMLSLGLGGWLAGMFHLFTHAFFKSLLFLCSGSVIHACGTNEMPQMGGLRKKMPITATTMLIGCLAIAGAGIPMLIGLSGYYSKDWIIAQDLAFRYANPRFGSLFFYVALIGAGMTAFYMFRLWFMTFAGNPRDGIVYHHAHESPKVMTVPLMILSLMAIGSGWTVMGWGLMPLLEQSQPAGISEGISGGLMWPSLNMPSRHAAHLAHGLAEFAAFGVALVGFLLAMAFYGLRKLDPSEAKSTFAPFYWFLSRKWLFDELYQVIFIRPLLVISNWVAATDKNGLDWLIDNTARAVQGLSRIDDWFDRLFVDGLVNSLARWTYTFGIRLRMLQSGSIRQYVLWLAIGTVALFVLTSLYWNFAFAGG